MEEHKPSWLTPKETHDAPVGKSRGWLKWAVIALTAIIVIVGGFIGVKTIFSNHDPIPETVRKQVSFAIFYPQDRKNYKVDQKHITYEANAGVLTYSVQLNSGVTIAINQQATPESFTDVPQVYDKLVTSLVPYGQFESVNGTVYLTHPKELSGGQSAVMNSKGTLIFARPARALSNEEWRKLFNNLTILKNQ